MYDGFNQHQLVAALALVSGTDVLRILGQWRDRRFGTLDWQFRGLVEGDGALLAGRPDLMMILAPFSTNFDLNAALRELDVSGGLNTKALSAATNLANRLGRALDPEFTQSALPDPLRVKDPDEFRRSTFDLTPDEQTERSTQIEKCKKQIMALDLTRTSDVDAAVRLQREARTYGDSLFIAETFFASRASVGPDPGRRIEF